MSGIDVRNSADPLLSERLCVSPSNAPVSTGPCTLTLLEQQADGTYKTFDFSSKTFKASGVSSGNSSAAMVYQRANGSTLETGVWTHALTTTTGLTKGRNYLAMMTNANAATPTEYRVFQWGGVDGDGIDVAGALHAEDVTKANLDKLVGLVGTDGKAIAQPVKLDVDDVTAKNIATKLDATISSRHAAGAAVSQVTGSVASVTGNVGGVTNPVAVSGKVDIGPNQNFYNNNNTAPGWYTGGVGGTGGGVNSDDVTTIITALHDAVAALPQMADITALGTADAGRANTALSHVDNIAAQVSALQAALTAILGNIQNQTDKLPFTSDGLVNCFAANVPNDYIRRGHEEDFPNFTVTVLGGGTGRLVAVRRV